MSTSSALPGDLAERLAPLASALVEQARDGLVVREAASGRWLYVNATMAQWLGREAQALVGRTGAELGELFGQSLASLNAAEQQAAGQDAACVAEHKVELGGVRRDFSVLRQRLRAADGRLLVASVWRDLAPERKREAQLRAALEQLEAQQQANEALRRQQSQGPAASPRDGDTGLYHRAHFEDQLRREVDLSTREHREFALVSIEIDPPSQEVAAIGVAARLRVLEALGRLLRGNTRAMDASCRYEDNRFLVLLSGVGLATAHSRMEGLRRQCATQIVVHDGREIGFTVSMGVASFPHTAQTQDDLRQACEAAVEDARQRGGNRVALASIRLAAE
jgi:diguanylate cyclase (GGDEF)-like protein